VGFEEHWNYGDARWQPLFNAGWKKELVDRSAAGGSQGSVMSEQLLKTPLGVLHLLWKDGRLERMEFTDGPQAPEAAPPAWPGDGNVSCAPVGTVFQQAVWSAMAKVPHGETATYGELAEQIGRPKAGRAVGTAVGANPLAVVLPCHRVLPAAGGLGGFRWGVKRKRRMLGWESDGLDALEQLCGVPSSRFKLCSWGGR
jgi:O-6-methylguanine DNA methyltransferase